VKITAVLRSHEFPLQIVKRCRQPFDGDDWLFEIKHDGSPRPRDPRMAARCVSSPATATTSASGMGFNRQLNESHAESFVVNGEILVLDEGGWRS